MKSPETSNRLIGSASTRRGSYYRLILDDGVRRQEPILAGRLAKQFRTLLLTLVNLQSASKHTSFASEYVSFWEKPHWWAEVFLKEAAEGPTELLKLRDELRSVWYSKALPSASRL